MKNQNYEKVYQETIKRRNEFWASLGAVESDVLAPIINPAFMGGPKFPSLRQAFVVIRREDHTLLATDCLSDPFDDEFELTVSGFGLELFIEVDERIEVGNAADHWALEILNEASLNAAHFGDFRERIEKYNVTTIGFSPDAVPNLPENWTSAEGIGAMINVDTPPDLPRSMNLPLGEVLLVPVKLLTPQELQLAITEKAAGREKLNGLFVGQRSYHVSSLRRKSVA